jgi:hypothetical protein
MATAEPASKMHLSLVPHQDAPKHDSALEQEDAEPGCSYCGGEVPLDATQCPDCGEFVGFPNVRYASASREITALDGRVASVYRELEASGQAELGREFETTVNSGSKAALCRTLHAMLLMTASEEDFCVPYYKLIEVGMRKAHSDALSRLRPIVDETYFPGYYRNIRFAALTIDDRGLQSYGPCTVILRSDLIAKRSSVFDGNTLIRLLQENPPLSKLTALPPGHRAPWAWRGKLALSALGGELTSSSTPESFPHMLLKTSANTADDEFIEVHIWGPITPRAVESVELPSSGTRADQLMVRAIREKLADLGINVRPDAKK